MLKRFTYELGRCLRETGSAIDRVGLRAIERPVFKEPCEFFRHTPRAARHVCRGCLACLQHASDMRVRCSCTPPPRAEPVREAPGGGEQRVCGSVRDGDWTRADPAQIVCVVWRRGAGRRERCRGAFERTVAPPLHPPAPLCMLRVSYLVLALWTQIGGYTNIGDRAVISTTKSVEGRPAATCRIGDYVTVGPGAILQSCTIENGVKIGAGAVVMEGALVESHAIVGAGAVVHPGRRIPSGQLWAGNPAAFVRNLTKEEMASFEGDAEFVADLGGEHSHEFLPEGTAYKSAPDDLLDDLASGAAFSR